MTDLTKTITKGAFGTVAAGAMALASASPAMANDRGRDRGIDAGDVIAGAVIIGGIAALAGAFDNNDRRDRNYNNRNYRDTNYNARGNRGFNGNPQRAIERCINAAERQAQRFGGYRYADVTQIRDVDRTRGGFRVQGRLQVEGSRNFRGRDFDNGRFTCYTDGRGRPQVEFRGIRGLR